MSTSIAERPPFMIIHIIRHATSDKERARTDNGISPKGELQCEELYKDMQKHAGYITHIFSSPMKRCLITARRGLRDVISRGIQIQPMPALAGRNGRMAWDLREDSDRDPSHGSWVSSPPGVRSKEKEVEFVDKFLKGEYFPIEEAQKTLEIVVIGQMQLLRGLKKKIAKNVKVRHGWPNATIFTYSLDTDGNWTRHSDQDSINDQRLIQQGWKKKIVEATAKRKQLEEERVEKRGVEKERIKKELESIEAKRAKLDQMLILLDNQAEMEEIQKDWEGSTESINLETKFEKLQRDLLKSQDSMLVVDPDTNEIVTFAEFQVILKKRHAEEFSAVIKPPKSLLEIEKSTIKRSADGALEPEPAAKKTRIILKPVARNTKAAAVESTVQKAESTAAKSEGEIKNTARGSVPKRSSQKAERQSSIGTDGFEESIFDT
ncbi:hypothetical protein EYC84_010885 [Monilinia fructicola]|uniref:Phosphoglycerate mutase family protein n=1 Tax=Monilinia fructicola TaxID=38448 RepID=A0A5M9J6I9_MONFR|nr:hypothetical protein EYC84_010885 [Monilinia fructicola]